jgi:hypothetical protein
LRCSKIFPVHAFPRRSVRFFLVVAWRATGVIRMGVFGALSVCRFAGGFSIMPDDILQTSRKAGSE